MVTKLSERRVCRALGQHRSTQRQAPRGHDDEEQLTADLIDLARRYGRYGYRKIAALLRDAGWIVNDKRVERIWRREGLKVPAKQPKRGRLWLPEAALPDWSATLLSPVETKDLPALAEQLEPTRPVPALLLGLSFWMLHHVECGRTAGHR